MIANFLWIGILLSGSFLGAFCFNRKFEETFPVSCMSSVVFLYIFGLLGNLKAGIIFLILLSAFCYILTLNKLLHARSEIIPSIQRMLTPAFFIFFAFFVVLNLADFNLLATGSDEFSHWMDSVKVMTQLDDFITNSSSHSLYPSYPPAMTLFQYFFQKIYLIINSGASFSEWRVYLAYQVFSIALLLPFLNKLSFKRPIELIFASIILLLLPTLFFANFYSSVYVDAFLGILAGSGLAMILLQDRKNAFYIVYTSLVCAILVLAKDVGMFFACFIAFAFFLDSFLGNKKQPKAKNAWLPILLSALPFLSLFAAKYTWKYEILTSGSQVIFGNNIDLLHYTSMFLFNNDATYKQTVVDTCKDVFYTMPFSVGDTSITINFFILFCITLFNVYFWYSRLISVQPEKKRTAITISSLSIVQLTVYIYCLGATYISNFSEFEALRVASYERYISIAFLAVWTSLLLLVLNVINHYPPNSKKTQTILLLTTCLLIISPMKNISDYLGRDTVRESRYYRSQYSILTDKIHQTCETTDKIYFVAQADPGDSFRVIKYTARPNIIANTSGWSLGKSFYTDDIWSEDLSVTEWKELLFDSYDYVAIYNLNDYFVQTYAELFQHPEEISENSIYYINKESMLLEKCE